ncbi:hypothetical protein RvY_05951 [Ramazzottius varieornatus]|uniref:Neuroblastoma-amplified sequence n=1 Tax=Ramazzottius varieornatus TaxID=947166 RepID=A0A1D1V2C7_RAMVA|nr:hypothetical protein RvY_05951 [Ramazzottius varieornatus]
MTGHSNNLQNGVLYEVLVSAEWNVTKSATGEKVNTDKPQPAHVPAYIHWMERIFYPFLWLFAWLSWTVSEYIATFSIPDALIKLKRSEIPWKLAAVRADNGKGLPGGDILAAVLTNSTLELRSSSDDFETSSQSFAVKSDAFPSFRNAVWSKDGKFVAVSSSDGTLSVDDCTNAEPQTLTTKPSADIASGLLRQRLISTMFWSDRLGRVELIACCTSGLLTSFLKRPDGQHSEGWSVNCRSHLPKCYKGTLSAIHARRQDLVVIASAVISTVDEDIRSFWDAGLSLWRFMDEAPYLVLVSDATSDEALQVSQTYRKLAKACDGAWKMSLSPSETCLLTLFLSGSVAVWSFPSLRLRKFYNVETMPRYEGEVSSAPASSTLDSTFELDAHFPLDAQWWSDTVIVLCQAGGIISLLDVTERVLTNAAHGSFEQFSPGCTISQNLGDRFFILEENSTGADASLHNTSSINDEEDIVSAVRQTLRSISSEDIAEGSEFDKRRNASFKLHCFKAASPLEMFNRKLQHEEYGEALLIAQRFNLDADVVYQRRWMTNRITKDTIAEFLMKVKDVSWVLRECLERVPDSPDVVRQLLHLGLSLTDLGKIAQSNPECYKDGKRSNDYLPGSVDVTKLTSEQLALIGHRRQLLRFSRFLTTYEEMLGGGEKASRYFLAAEYGELRRMTPLHVAVYFAENCKARELHTFRYSNHDELWPHWLDILSHFPETFPPGEYQFLIPSVWNDSIVEVQSGSEEPRDWSEIEPFASTLDIESKSRLEADARLVEKMQYRMTPTVEGLTDWFSVRVREIESRTGNIVDAQELLQIASAKGVFGLDKLFDDLDTLASLVYYCGQIELTLEEMQGLSPGQILRLLEQPRKPEVFSTAVRQHIVPFLIRCEKRQVGSRQALMREFLLETAADPQLGLDKCLKVFQQSMPGMAEPAIDSVEGTVRLALECISVTSRVDQLEQMKAILDSLPSSSELQSALDKELATEVENVTELVRTIEFAEQYGSQLSIKSLQEIQEESHRSLDFVKHILTRAVQKPAGFSELDWKDIYTSYMKACQKVFPAHINPDQALELFVRALLMSAKPDYVQLSTKFLPLPVAAPAFSPRPTHAEVWKVSKRLSKETSAHLLLTAGREYFVGADDFRDAKIQLAKRCFDLATDLTPDAKKEAQLIDALAFLDGCGLTVAPLELLTSKDRFVFIKRALDTRGDLYKDQVRLKELAALLDIDDSIQKIVEAVAEKAFEKKDLAFARGLCQKFMAENRASAWELCVKLASAEGFEDADFRQRLLLFATVNCPPNQLNRVTSLKNQVQTLSPRMISTVSDEEVDREPIAKLAVDPCFLSAVEHGRHVTSLSFLSMIKEMKNLKVVANSLNGEDSEEDMSEVFIAAASKCLDVDTGLSLFLLGCLPDKSTAERLFDSLPQTPAVRRLATYFYALELALNKASVTEVAEVLNADEATIVDRATKEASSGDKKDASLAGLMRKHLSKNPAKQPPLTVRKSGRIAQKETAKGAPFSNLTVPPPIAASITPQAPQSSPKSEISSGPPPSAAKTATANLRTFLKGVDEAKFRSNPEYRKSFILRSAATKDIQTLQKLIQIAEENGIEGWEVLAAVIKYFYTVSGLSADEITILSSKIPDLVQTLRSRKGDFLRFSNQNIQPYMGNADMSVLESYLDFLHCIEKAT